MRSIGFRLAGPIDRDDALIEVDTPVPVPAGRDLLVEIKAVSVNPVDAKVRANTVLPVDGSLLASLDMGQQGRILNRLADLVDSGQLKTTLTERLGPISVENLRRAHAMVESAGMRGKVVLEGW